MTVAELENRLGSGELKRWHAYHEIEPFGQSRDNYHAALIASAVINYSGYAKSAKSVDDFMFVHRLQRAKNAEDHRMANIAHTRDMLNAIAKKPNGPK